MLKILFLFVVVSFSQTLLAEDSLWFTCKASKFVLPHSETPTGWTATIGVVKGTSGYVKVVVNPNGEDGVVHFTLYYVDPKTAGATRVEAANYLATYFKMQVPKVELKSGAAPLENVKGRVRFYMDAEGHLLGDAGSKAVPEMWRGEWSADVTCTLFPPGTGVPE